jgi:hypothetical protein
VEPEPEPQRDVAMSPTALAPNLMFNIGGLSNSSHTVTVSYFSHSLSWQFNSEEIRRKNLPNPHGNFCLLFCVQLATMFEWKKSQTKLISQTNDDSKDQVSFAKFSLNFTNIHFSKPQKGK